MTSISSKQFGSEKLIAKLVADACILAMPKNAKNFNVDNVRVVKIMGSSLGESSVVQGMVFNRESEGDVAKATNAKIAVFSCPIDVSKSETKGTVLIHNAQEMMDFSKGEEKLLEQVSQL